MFEHFEKPAEAYRFKLGAALTMEQTIADMLGENAEAAQDERVKQLLRTHRDETRHHVEVLEQVFGAFEWEIDDSPSPRSRGWRRRARP